MEYTLKTSRPKRSKYIFTFIYLFPLTYNYNSIQNLLPFTAASFRQHNALQ
jgi:hypothetical protein